MDSAIVPRGGRYNPKRRFVYIIFTLRVHRRAPSPLCSLVAGLFLAQGTVSCCLAQSSDRAREAPTSTFLYSSLSTSYSTSNNWQGSDLQNFAFLGNVLYKHAAWDSTRSHAHQVLADLGYLKFVDSTWVKSVDRVQVTCCGAPTGASSKALIRYCSAHSSYRTFVPPTTQS